MRENEEGNFNWRTIMIVNYVSTKEESVEPGEELLFFDQVDFVRSFVIWGTG